MGSVSTAGKWNVESVLLVCEWRACLCCLKQRVESVLLSETYRVESVLLSETYRVESVLLSETYRVESVLLFESGECVSV